jgi:hypothetical protein
VGSIPTQLSQKTPEKPGFFRSSAKLHAWGKSAGATPVLPERVKTMANRWIVELEDPTGSYSRERVEQVLRMPILKSASLGSDQAGNPQYFRLISVKEATLPPQGGASQ